MIIDRIDHFVLTVRDVQTTCDFYQRALGMTPEVFGSGRTALKFGHQKINLHLFGHEPEPKASSPAPGGGDFLSDHQDAYGRRCAAPRSCGCKDRLDAEPAHRCNGAH